MNKPSSGRHDLIRHMVERHDGETEMREFRNNSFAHVGVRFFVALIISAPIVFLATATSVHAEVFEMVCNNDRVAPGRVAVDFYYIIDTTASTVTDRTAAPGTYHAQITQGIIDWTEPGWVYRFDRIAGHLVRAPNSDPNNSAWGLICKRIQARF
jgi:hypothetical protein